ncbi:hypothetical protein MKX50_02405 [Paenibacillus sp. FSL W8-0186]|uniref:hypothetical protein n=1 Tax=Paenibacillus sp. FSL W8-0186 TaxID=2921709 RepID=UPI0030CD1A8E
MDFSKFLSIIESGSLFLTKVNKMSDLLEGKYPMKTRQSWERAHMHLPQFLRDIIIENQTENYKSLSETTYISCWRADDKTSYHMWDAYTKGIDGIAIKSTTKRLHGGLFKFRAEIGLPVHIAKVFYVDFNKDASANDLLIYQFINKSKDYRHEKEFRAILMEGLIPTTNFNREALRINHENGIGYPVDINLLIDEVHITPFASKDYKRNVEELLLKYNINKPVFQDEVIDIY